MEFGSAKVVLNLIIMLLWHFVVEVDFVATFALMWVVVGIVSVVHPIILMY